MRVLLVEDDKSLGDGLRMGLQQHEYQVDWLQDGAQASQAIFNEFFDIIILDLGLPRKSGWEILRKMRARNNSTPVLILTALDEIESRVEGLDAGADDYLVKPFALEEICARLRALIRRSNARSTPTINYKTLVMDPSAHSVVLDGETLVLSRREFALLRKLLENVGKVISREQMAQTLYGWSNNIDSNALEVHIHHLRKKLAGRIPIRTIRGVGYILEKEEQH